MNNIKYALLPLLLLIATSAVAGETATLAIAREGRTRTLHLQRDSGGVLCKAPGQPARHIQVKGLKGLEAPFVSAVPARNCVQTLTWATPKRKATTCYRFGDNEVLDDVLRWCTSL